VHGISLAVVPLGYGVLREALPRHRIGFALGLTSGLMGGTSGAALVLSGLIVDHVSWRWLFAVGAVLIAVALTLVLRYVPISPRSRQGRPDVLGAAVLALGLLGVLLGLTEGPCLGWLSPTVLGLFLVGAGGLTGFVVLARLTTDPLLDVGLLARPAVLVANFGAFVLGVTQFVFYVLLPKLAELPDGLPPALAHRIDYGFGLSVTAAGLILLPGTLVMLPASSSAGRVARAFGPRAPLALGLGVAGFGAAALALAHARPWQVVLLFVVFSLGSGLATGALPKIVNDAVAADETATANGVNVVARIVGGAVGSQLAAAVVSSFPLRGTHLPAATGFTAAFWVSAGTATVGALITLLAVWPRANA
jgi:MFS family permease